MSVMTGNDDATSAVPNGLLPRDASALYRRAFERAPDPAFVLRPDGAIVDANAAAVAAYGYDLAALRSLRFQALADGPSAGTISGHLSRRLTAPAVIRILQRRRDGTAFPAEVDLADAGVGGERLVVAFVRDVGGQDDIVAALRESEERLRLALEASPIVVYKQDHDLRYTWLYNLDRAVWPDEVAGRTDDDLLPPAEAAVSVALKRRAMTSGSRVREEVRATAPTGERVYDLTIEPLKDEEGASLGVTGTAVDVTERRRVEESLRWQADLLDQAYDAIFAWGWDGSILFWNRGAERLYGHAREDAVGRVSHDLLRTRHPQATEQMLRALERDGVWEAELEHLRRDGSVVPVETRHVLVRGVGRPYVLEVNRDISERRRAEGALRESEQRLRLAARAARLGTWRFDPATGLVHLDDRMRAIWGEPAGVASLPISEVLGRVHPNDRAAVEGAVAGALDPGSSGSYDIEYRVVWPDGTERWVAANGQATFGPPDAGEHSVGFVGTALDITERKLAEVERTAFVDALAHDLKNPLGAALGQAQLLQRRIRRHAAVGPDALLAGLGAAEASIRRAVDLIDGMLAAARGEAVESAPGVAVVDLVALAREAVDEARRATVEQPVRLESETTELLGAWDAVAVRRAVDNLLANAVKYSPGGTGVVVRLGREDHPRGSWAVLSVVDRGIGIPADDLPRVFERFHRGGNVDGIAGSGVGLAGAKQAIEGNGGSIAVESAEGEGSTFTIRLPVVTGAG